MERFASLVGVKPKSAEKPSEPKVNVDQHADECAIESGSDEEPPPPAPKFQKMNDIWYKKSKKAHSTAREPIYIDFKKHSIDVLAHRRIEERKVSYDHEVTVQALKDHIDVFGPNEHHRRLFGYLDESRNYTPRKKAEFCGQGPLDWDSATEYLKMSEEKRALRLALGIVPRVEQQDGGVPQYAQPDTQLQEYLRGHLAGRGPRKVQVPRMALANELCRLDEPGNAGWRRDVHRAHQQMASKSCPQDEDPESATTIRYRRERFRLVQSKVSLLTQQLHACDNSPRAPATAMTTPVHRDVLDLHHTPRVKQPVTILQGLPSPTPHTPPTSICHSAASSSVHDDVTSGEDSDHSHRLISSNSTPPSSPVKSSPRPPRVQRQHETAELQEYQEGHEEEEYREDHKQEQNQELALLEMRRKIRFAPLPNKYLDAY